MTTPSLIQKLEQIAQKYHPRSKLLHIGDLKGGLSAQMSALKLLLPDGQIQKVIVRQPGDKTFKRNPHAAAEEFRILQIVRAAGVRAPAPYLLDSSGEIFAEPYLVIEYIEGEPQYAPADVAAFVRQMAAQLATIHRLDSARVDLSFLPQQSARLVSRLAQQAAKLDDSLQEGAIRELLTQHWPLPSADEAVLVHGDFWPGNLLWQEGNLVAVIDWEDAEVGNPLVDFAISRLDILWIFGRDAMQEFTHHYQALRTADYSQLPYWDLFAALRPASRIAEWAAGWPELGRSDITEQTMRAGHAWFVNQAIESLASR